MVSCSRFAPAAPLAHAVLGAVVLGEDLARLGVQMRVGRGQRDILHALGSECGPYACFRRPCGHVNWIACMSTSSQPVVQREVPCPRVER